MKTAILPSALYWASFNRFELRLPGEAVLDIARSGDNGPAVDFWAPRIMNEWPDRATPDAIRAELKEHGAWDADELTDDAANWRRLIWLAAHNIAEEDAPDCAPSVDESKELRKRDARWGIARIFCGYPKARHHVRFCGETLTHFATLKDARAARQVARLAYLRALRAGVDPLPAAKRALSEL